MTNTTPTTTIDLFDSKGSCELCSTTLVKRRVNRADFAAHARAHKAQGDPVELSYSAGIRTGATGPDVFKVAADGPPVDNDADGYAAQHERDLAEHYAGTVDPAECPICLSDAPDNSEASSPAGWRAPDTAQYGPHGMNGGRR